MGKKTITQSSHTAFFVILAILGVAVLVIVVSAVEKPGNSQDIRNQAAAPTDLTPGTDSLSLQQDLNSLQVDSIDQDLARFNTTQ